MFYSRNKKNNAYPRKPLFYYINGGLRMSKLYRRVFVMFDDEFPSATPSGVCTCISQRRFARATSQAGDFNNGNKHLIIRAQLFKASLA